MKVEIRELKEFVEFVNKQKLKNVEVFGQDKPSNSNKIQILYDLIHDQNIDSEKELAQILYDDDESNINYKRLKSRLMNKLINSLFLIKVGTQNKADRIYARKECIKIWAAIKILSSNAKPNIYLPLAEKLLKRSIRFEFSEISYDLCKLCWATYTLYSQNEKKLKFYEKKMNQFKKLAESEDFLFIKTGVISGKLIRNKTFKKQLQLELNKIENEFLEIIEKYQSFEIYRSVYSMSILRFEYEKDFQNALEKSKEYIEYLKSKTFDISHYLITIYVRVMSCYLYFKDFDKGSQLWHDEVLPQFNEISTSRSNKYISLVYLILCFHTKNYQEAYTVFLLMKKQFGSQKSYLIVEDLNIVEAYLEYLILEGLIKVEEGEVRKFRISKFLNEVPEYSKDKRGNNISILIIQLLFLLQKKKYSEVTDRVEALNMYRHRYLKDNGHFRSNCFIKMLLLLPESKYHKQGFLRKADKLFRKLLNHPLESSLETTEFEIVPYEHLWEILTSTLENKFVKETKLIRNSHQ